MSLHRHLCGPRPYRRTIVPGLLSALLVAAVYLLWSGCGLLLRPAHCRLLGRAWEQAPPAEGGLGDEAIDGLIREARLQFRAVVERRSTTLRQAARRYRERRGRHPPPGFDAWFAAASKSRAVVVEDFFDRIHHDIGPLWALEPRRLRRKARDQASVIRVRGGAVDAAALPRDMPHRVEQWAKLVGELASVLPDLDMPVNTMDESRVLVPWETVDAYMAEERRQRRLVDVTEARDRYGGDGLDNSTLADDDDDTRWITDEAPAYWDHLARACPPDSPARRVPALPRFGESIEYPSHPVAAYTRGGFVANFTASQDPCWQPHLRGMHGTFVESISMSTTHELIPLFAESKLPRNNELLIPAAVYLDDGRTDYSGGGARGGPWARKRAAVVWRGVSSGGRNRRETWRHMHRNRFVQMLNGTAVAALEAGDEARVPTFRLPDPAAYPVAARDRGLLGPWVSSWADAGFVEAPCHPPEDVEELPRPGHPPAKFCAWLRPWFSMVDGVSMQEQYMSKFLPDIDGNSFSGRYRAFLLSTSLPFKSTIYAEWHDDRLFPWVHFVPMDNSFIDVYGLVDYFVDGGHDAEARTMAEDGKAWAEAVLRREDMRLYVWRLLLEYARVVDDDRHNLAFVADLTG